VNYIQTFKMHRAEKHFPSWLWKQVSQCCTGK